MHISIDRHTITHFIAFCFTELHKYCIFPPKLKVGGNCTSSKSIGTIFPAAFAYFMSLCHVLVTLTIFPTFSILSYLSWQSVISDLWCYYYSLLKASLLCVFPLCVWAYASLCTDTHTHTHTHTSCWLCFSQVKECWGMPKTTQKIREGKTWVLPRGNTVPMTHWFWTCRTVRDCCCCC